MRKSSTQRRTVRLTVHREGLDERVLRKVEMLITPFSPQHAYRCQHAGRRALTEEVANVLLTARPGETRVGG